MFCPPGYTTLQEGNGNQCNGREFFRIKSERDQFNFITKYLFYFKKLTHNNSLSLFVIQSVLGITLEIQVTMNVCPVFQDIQHCKKGVTSAMVKNF